MNVALYHPWLKQKGGAEKVVLETAERSEHDVTVYTLFYDPEETFPRFQELDIEVLGRRTEPRGFIDAGLRFGLGAILRKIPERHDRLLVSEAGLGSLITFRNSSIPTTCYCHTPLLPALPEFKQTYLNELNPVIRPFYRIGLKIYDFLEQEAWKNFDTVVANSETTKKRIIEKGLRNRDEIQVFNPGSDIDNEPGEYENYFLYPSRFRRYKRQDLAIEAFKEADLDDFKLILAGSAQEKDFVEELKVEASGLRNVEVRTDLPGDEWEDLYRNAYSVLFLAEKEDWGIIPVEAGSYGKPVIAVNEGGPRESVIDGETGFLVEADKNAIAEKMKELASNPDKVKEMGEQGLENVKQYSWSNFSDKLDEVLSSKSGQ